MLRVFGHYVRISVLLLFTLELMLVSCLFYIIAQAVVLPDLPPALVHREFILVIPPALLLLVVMYSLGAYEPAVQLDLGRLWKGLLLTCIVGDAALMALFYWNGGSYSGDAILFFSIYTVSFLVIILTVRGALRWGVVTLGALKPRILVLGTGRQAEHVRALIMGSKRMALHGFVPMGKENGVTSGQVPANMVLSDFNPLCDHALRDGISEIVVALDDRRGVLPTGQLIDCRLSGIKVIDGSTFCEREVGKVDLESLYPSWLIFSEGFRFSRFGLAIKRVFDILVSLAVLTLSMPVLVLAAIAVKLDSSGPLFFIQTRVGLHGRHFRLLKFRSMTVNAERDGLPQWAALNDSRVTRVGRIIRKYRIDEFPQLYNVLRGDMSFVGPRPERPFFVDNLAMNIPYYHHRHKVKPGLTGWAQINYPYGASISDAQEKLKYDLYYVKNNSIFLDAMIILKTIRVIVFTEGAR